MGSTGQATMTGFICRLCSKQRKIVIHLYTSRAKKLDLINKIKLLPISLQLHDNLPKTICEPCIEKLEMQYRLVKKIRESNKLYQVHRIYHGDARSCDPCCPLHERHFEPEDDEND
ncbi:uncharacterized protein LOC126739134 [Anthonomus grandis grandis]|uniref:uncharacterized protein LOC126739134 n=1 Tax=Anthonomus grandis grandis TaxID=2921223 RepID=UPI00216519EB|nr:uncharacterized protein LOC126739134 [Anthonomus grandis grandis]